MNHIGRDDGLQSRLERKKERTRRRIIETGIRLVRQYGFEAATMEQIAEEADIAKGTLYNYFPSKEAIISAYVAQAFSERHPDRISQLRQLPDTRSRLAAILENLMERVQAQQDVFEWFLAYRVRHVVSLRPDMSEEVKSGFGALAVEIIQLGQQSAEIRDDLPLDIMVDLFEFIFVEIAKQFYAAPETFDVHRAIEQGVSLFLSGTQKRS